MNNMNDDQKQAAANSLGMSTMELEELLMERPELAEQMAQAFGADLMQDQYGKMANTQVQGTRDGVGPYGVTMATPWSAAAQALDKGYGGYMMKKGAETQQNAQQGMLDALRGGPRGQAPAPVTRGAGMPDAPGMGRDSAIGAPPGAGMQPNLPDNISAPLSSYEDEVSMPGAGSPTKPAPATQPVPPAGQATATPLPAEDPLPTPTPIPSTRSGRRPAGTSVSDAIDALGGWWEDNQSPGVRTRGRRKMRR